MSYGRYGGGPPDNRRPGQGQQPVNPWQGGGFPAGGGSGNQGNLSMNLLGTLMNNSGGSGSMANLATSLVAQALQNKPGGMIIGGNHFGGSGPMGMDSGGPSRGGFMDRSGPRDDYRRHHRDARSNSSSRRPNFRHRSRSRSPIRDAHRGRGSRRDQDSRNQRATPRSKPMRAGSPKDRAPFEIYIGNYPVRFREADVRNLFQEHGVQVSTIRLKHDGHKVFAFAETTGEDEIQKAIKAMDSKEIHGRRLRVRSSKDKDRKDKQGSDEKKFRAPTKRELTEDDVTKHLAYAFTGFLTRQAAKEEMSDAKKDQLEQVQVLLKEAFDLPDDDSLKISRNLELIFLQNNRREIPVPEVKPEAIEPTADEATEKVEEDADENAEENGATDEPIKEEVEAKIEEESEDVSAQVELETKDEEEKDEEDELMDQLGDAVENLIEEEIKTEEAQEEEEANTEPEVQEDSAPVRGGRGRGGRGAGRARRSRGRRGTA